MGGSTELRPAACTLPGLGEGGGDDADAAADVQQRAEEALSARQTRAVAFTLPVSFEVAQMCPER